MGKIRRRFAALMLSAFAATSIVGMSVAPAYAAASGTAPAAARSEGSSGLLGGLLGEGGLITVFIGNYQINH